MSGAIRNIGINAPIYVAVATACDMRSGRWEPDRIDAIIRRGTDSLLGQQVAQQSIREAQRFLVNGVDIFSGPDTDTISPWLRFDGCHFSHMGLRKHADLWFEAITKQTR